MNYGVYFDYEGIQSKIKEIENLMLNSGFWDDKENADSLIKNLSSLKQTLKEMNSINEKLEFVNEVIELEFNDLITEAFDNINQIDKEIEILELKSLFTEESDNQNCLIEINSGAGGDESCDFVGMLYRMYTRYCEKNGYSTSLTYSLPREEGGFKSIGFEINGEYAFGKFKSENGVHRLIRLSPFDSSNRRHTSFAAVSVSPIFTNDIDIVIKDSDIKVDVYRSSGAGGQSVNTTDSAVRMTHIKTGVVVTCQNERSQIKNREKALKILKSKLYLMELEKLKSEKSSLNDNKSENEFGSQIRTYTMHPYTLVKDHRTLCEKTDVNKVLDGDIEDFMYAYLKGEKNENKI